MAVDTKKLRELADRATPGPWEHERHEGEFRGTGVIWQQDPDVVPGQYSSPNIKIVARVEYCSTGWNKRPDEEFDASADFIAAANPTVIKALLDALDCQREALDELASEGNVKAHNARAKAARLLGQGG